MAEGSSVKKSQIDYQLVTASFFQKMPSGWNELPSGPYWVLGNMKTFPVNGLLRQHVDGCGTGIALMKIPLQVTPCD